VRDAPDSRQRPRTWIGTSGWSYDHWSGVFYPEHLAASHRLEYYASVFSTVEIDATFYRLPSEATVRRWHDTVPADFVFAVKGSRFITHYRRLAGIDEMLATFLGRVGQLADKLGVVLWQLPPTLVRDDARLASFLGVLRDTGVRHAIEFRHESWLAEEVFSAMTAACVAAVHVSGDVVREEFTPTADFVYARFHGTARYHGAYSEPALEPWAGFLREQRAAGRDCYAYFNNDAEGHAPADAQRLMGMLGPKA